MPNDVDAELVPGLQRGDRAAFERTYAVFHARIYAFLLRLSGHRDVADDLFQDTFLALARGAPRLRDDTDLAAWLFTVARNAHTSYRRWKMLDVSRWVVLGDDLAPASLALGPDDQTEATRAGRRLERALTDLRAADREVLLLVGVDGLEQEQVAHVLGVSYDALRKRLSRARTALSERLAELEGAES